MHNSEHLSSVNIRFASKSHADGNSFLLLSLFSSKSFKEFFFHNGNKISQIARGNLTHSKWVWWKELLWKEQFWHHRQCQYQQAAFFIKGSMLTDSWIFTWKFSRFKTNKEYFNCLETAHWLYKALDFDNWSSLDFHK